MSSLHPTAADLQDTDHHSTIGAGDTFIAGMLYALNCQDKDWNLLKKLEFANRIAGMKVSQEGFSELHRALVSYV